MKDIVEPFGTLPSGERVDRITLSNSPLTAKILTLGAIVQDLRLEGHPHPLVLGAPDLTPYLGVMKYFGALVGRFANRIANGRFEVGGKSYQLPLNWRDRHTLHGGTIGAGQKIWLVEKVTSSSVKLSLTLPDGDMGFPGTLKAVTRISLTENGALDFDITATTDATTPCSFAHHGFFCLDGSGGISDHTLSINADTYLPVDEDLIPTGEIADVADTKFDFRDAKPIGRSGYDHNFCLNQYDGRLRPAAYLSSPESGVSMTVRTDQPGLQIYDGSYIPESGFPGLDGQTYGPFAGIAMETQSWPDAPNQSGFPNALLNPGDTYRHRVIYQFQKV